jgi:hypothetical protein
MLLRKITDIRSENHTRHITTGCQQNVVIFNIKASGMHSSQMETDHWGDQGVGG